MAKVSKAPFGVSGLHIHGSKDQTGDECTPHCHLGCMGQIITISFENDDIKIIKGNDLIDCTKANEIIDWVRSNLTSFWEIWNTNS